MASYLTLLEQLSTAVDQLNQVLQGDENTTVDINGKVQPSVQKKTLDEVNAKVQLVLDASSDIDAVKYGTVDLGLAATLDGQFFSVVSSDPENYLDLYKNDAGVATFKKSYPSIAAVSSKYSINERISTLANRVKFEKDELIGPMNRLGAIDNRALWDVIDGELHLASLHSTAANFWSRGQSRKKGIKTAIRIAFKLTAGDEFDSKGVAISIGNTPGYFIGYTANGFIGLFSNTGAALPPYYALDEDMKYAIGEQVYLEVTINSDNTLNVTAEKGELRKSWSYSEHLNFQDGIVWAGVRNNCELIISEFTVSEVIDSGVNTETLNDKVYNLAYQLKFNKEDVVNPVNYLGTTLRDATWDIDSEGVLNIENSITRPFFTKGHEIFEGESTEVEVEFELTSENSSSSRGVLIAIGDLDYNAFMTSNGAVGIHTNSGGVLQEYTSVASELAFDALQKVKLVVGIDSEGVIKLTAHANNRSRSWIYPPLYSFRAGKVWVGWRVNEPGKIHSLIVRRTNPRIETLPTEPPAEVSNKLPKNYAVRKSPEGFTWEHPYPVIYDNLLGYTLLLDPTELKGGGSVYYIDSEAQGTNDGSSWENAFNNATLAISELNAMGTDAKTIYVKSGWYSSLYTVKFDCTLICEDGQANFVDDTSLTWDLDSGNVYTSTLIGLTPYQILDRSLNDGYGNPFRLTPVSSIVECQELAGSYYINNETIHVHTKNGEAPTTELRVTTSSLPSASFTKRAYIENISLLSGGSVTGPYSGDFIGVNSKFGYSNERDSFAVRRNRGMLVLLWGCIAMHGGRDGFNYHAVGTTEPCADVIEVNCLGYENGYDTSVNSNNGSTMHDGGRIIRINCTYTRNENRNVHDIGDGTEVWMLGSRAGEARNPAVSGFDSANFLVGLTSTGSNTKTWLESCDSLGGSTSDFAVYGSSELKVRNCNISNYTVVDGTGTVSSY